MNFNRIGKIGVFDVYIETSSKEYAAKNEKNGDILRDESLDSLKEKIKNYKDELAEYFADMIDKAGLRLPKYNVSIHEELIEFRNLLKEK